MAKLLALLPLLLCHGCGHEMRADIPAAPTPPEPQVAISAGNVGDRNSEASRATLGAVSSAPSENDPFRESSAPFAGRLLYASRVYKAPLALNTITVRNVGGAGGDGLATSYAIENIGKQFVFGPQFSPDGRFVLFKAGRVGDPYDLYYLYVLDTQLRQLKLVAKRALTYHKVSWSPDGRFVAYTEGGDWLGYEDGHTNPLRLYVCEWRTGRERLVVQNPGVQESFAWAAPHTLFYSAQAKVASASSAHSVQRSDTYRLDAAGGASRLVIRDAWRPHPSPDGRWLAFLGSAGRQPFDMSWRWSEEASPALCLARADGTARRVLRRRQATASFLVWQHGSRSFLTLDQSSPSPANQITVSSWDIATRRRRHLATLSARDFKEIIRDRLDAPIVPLSVSRDGRVLFAATYTMAGKVRDQARYITDESVVSLDLRTGKAARVARLRDSTELDWHQDP